MTLPKAEQARRKAVTAQKLEAVRACVLDGWSLREIYRTHKTSSRFMKRYFPDYTGMPPEESGSLSMAIQRHKRKTREEV